MLEKYMKMIKQKQKKIKINEFDKYNLHKTMDKINQDKNTAYIERKKFFFCIQYLLFL